MLFLLWFYFDVLLPKRLNFGDFDVPALEVVTEHYLLWDWETSHFLQAIRVSSVLHFYFLYSPFLWVSLHLPLGNTGTRVDVLLIFVNRNIIIMITIIIQIIIIITIEVIVKIVIIRNCLFQPGDIFVESTTDAADFSVTF